MRPEIDIAVEHDAWRVVGDLEGLIERAAVAAVASSGRTLAEGVELSVVLCDDTFIRDLNRTWRGKDKATNVLSFPMLEQTQGHALGDIVVAYQTSAAEAESEGRALTDHLSHLIVHGVFHLLGFDHETDSEADAMERLEGHTLAMLGIASPYQVSTTVDAEDARAEP